MQEIFIRKYSNSDRKVVRGISRQTAFLGISKEFFFDDDEILKVLWCLSEWENLN